VQDVQDVLQQHAAVLDQLPPDFQPHEVLTTVSNLLRVLKVSLQRCAPCSVSLSSDGDYQQLC
jgi:hypothetical protein